MLKSIKNILKKDCNLQFLTFASCPATNVRTEQDDGPRMIPWETAKPYEDIPGPKPLPLIGNLHRFLPLIGEYYTPQNDHTHFLEKLAEDFGVVARFPGQLGHPDHVFVYDPIETEKIYRNAGQWPQRGGIPSLLRYREKIRNDLYDGVYGLLISEDEKWYNFRSVVNQVMMRPQVAKLYLESIDKVSEDFIDRIRFIRNDDDEMPHDFANELNKWSLESIGLVAFDTRFGLLKKHLSPDSDEQKLIESVLQWFELWYKLDATPSLYNFYDTKNWKKFISTMDYFNEVAMKYVDAAVQRIVNKPKDDEGEKSVLERLITIDKKIATVMALDTLQAGIDTTAQSAAIILYYLAMNPEKQETLRKELELMAPHGKINSKNYGQLVYLRACIKEALRISPPVYANQRCAPKDLVVSGYRVPKGTRLVLCHMVMSNTEEYFPEPKKYIPERWMRSNAEIANINKFACMPFGFGSRACIGRRFAEMEIETLIARIITNFDLSWNYGEMTFRTKILYVGSKPWKFKLVDRKRV